MKALPVLLLALLGYAPAAGAEYPIADAPTEAAPLSEVEEQVLRLETAAFVSQFPVRPLPLEERQERRRTAQLESSLLPGTSRSDDRPRARDRQGERRRIRELIEARVPVVEIRYYPDVSIENGKREDLYVVTRYLYDSGLIRETPVSMPGGKVHDAVESRPLRPIPFAPGEIEVVHRLLRDYLQKKGMGEDMLKQVVFFPQSFFQTSDDSPFAGKRLARVAVAGPGEVESLIGGPVQFNLSDGVLIEGQDDHAR